MAKRRSVTKEDAKEQEVSPDASESPSVEPEAKTDDTQNLPDAPEPSSMIDPTSTKSGMNEAICFKCHFFTPGDYGPRCMNHESPFYTKRVDDDETCEKFTER